MTSISLARRAGYTMVDSYYRWTVTDSVDFFLYYIVDLPLNHLVYIK